MSTDLLWNCHISLIINLIRFPLNAKLSFFLIWKWWLKRLFLCKSRLIIFLVNIAWQISLQNILTWHFFRSKGFCCFFKFNGKNPKFFTSSPQSSGLQAVSWSVPSPPQQPCVLHSLDLNLALSFLQGWEHAVQLLQFPQLSTF